MPSASRTLIQSIFATLFLLSLTSGCGKATPIPELESTTNPNAYRETNWEVPAVRIVFHRDNFTDIEDFRTSKHTQFQCLGDATKVYKVDADDYSGAPTAFTSSSASDDFSITTHPAFIKAISLDMTQTYFANTQSNVVQTDACSYRGIGGTAAPSSCADFDSVPSPAPSPTVVPPASTPWPSPIPTTTPATTQYYETGFYRVRDDWCSQQGPILSSDPETTKSNVGGVSIDLDRSELGASEDLLMVVTYHSLNSNTGTGSWPGVQATADHTVMKVSLVGTALDLSTLMQMKQPRAWTFFQSVTYPTYWSNVASLEDPFGSLRSEQVYLPVSKSSAIDRIRIERVRGSFHLFQVDLYRLGNRS